MRYYFAPMEGLTDSIYRRLHHQFFPGLDRYYMPFLSPTVHRTLTPRESRELPIADSVPFSAIPQILTKVSEDFIWVAQQCAHRGYREVNLNLGCPSGTVVSKGKGAGMLRDPDALDRFLEEIFTHTPVAVSVKTRLGMENPEEFYRLLDIYNRYPIAELTVHPRVRRAFYNGDVDLEMFAHCMAHSKNPLCYNGNLCAVEDIAMIGTKFPQIQAVMIGRGLIGDPGMLIPGGTTAAALEPFLDGLLEEYTLHFGGVRNAMFRLKENWRHLLCRFEDSGKLGKALRKTTDAAEYRRLTHEICTTLALKPRLEPDWDCF